MIWLWIQGSPSTATRGHFALSSSQNQHSHEKIGARSKSGGQGLPKRAIKIWSHCTKHTFIAGRQTTQRDLERKYISFLNAAASFAIQQSVFCTM